MSRGRLRAAVGTAGAMLLQGVLSLQGVRAGGRFFTPALTLLRLPSQHQQPLRRSSSSSCGCGFISVGGDRVGRGSAGLGSRTSSSSSATASRHGQQRGGAGSRRRAGGLAGGFVLGGVAATLLGSTTPHGGGGGLAGAAAAEAKAAAGAGGSSAGGGRHNSISSSSKASSRLEALRRPKVIFVLGGPGAGKGTQCDKLMKDYSLVHLSAGELLRRERSSGSPDGNLIEEYITQGKIVPVRISLSLLKREMDGCRGSCNRFLIDGFPRNFDNVQGWEEVMSGVADVEAVLAIDCPEDVLTERLMKRGETSGRSDDNVETALKRFKTYQEATRPVIEYYDRQGKAVAVPGQLTPDEVYQRIQAQVDPIFQQEIVSHTEALLQSIAEGDWSSYAELCDEAMTCLEPEAKGQVVHGLDFHRVYFDKGNTLGAQHTSTISQPKVKLLGRGGAAVITYIRLVQSWDQASGQHQSAAYEETRVWHMKAGKWRCVHFHRSRPS